MSPQKDPEQEQEEIKRYLDSELAKHRDALHEARMDNDRKRFESLNRYSSFVLKLSDSALIIAAGIGPALMVADKVSLFPGYSIGAVTLFLSAGALGLWKGKSLAESQLDGFAINATHELELDSYRMSFPLNKWLLALSRNETADEVIEGYKEEYRLAQKEFLLKDLEEPKPPRWNIPDISLNILVSMFVWGVLLILRFIWSSSDELYCAFTATVSFILYGATLIEARKVLDLKESRDKISKELRAHKRTQAEWKIKEGLGMDISPESSTSPSA